MSNVTYSFVNDEQNNELIFRSKVDSFGLDHTNDKNLTSFYMNFSDKAYFDSGLLPVDGSGILSIRSAGTHTQIGYQHKPGMYYINWGSYERDPNAAKIYVAQPYRIVIADLYNGNLLGARTFYSPIPVQHPQTPLYHINLPNINCKGYRGNGVGWICLYHNEDISTYPFNEKVAKILERCSGVEAYNDQNMSETDGPRFYNQNHKPRFLWDPTEWEKHSEKFGVDWTLDPDLWIPVLVKDLDHQEKHYEDGEPLTYADAILGDYQAYYHDSIRPKPVNILTRQDLAVDKNLVFNWFKSSYNSSQQAGTELKKENALSSTEKVREQLSKIFVPPPQVHSEEDEEETPFDQCYYCEESIWNEDDAVLDINSNIICSSCAENSHYWINHLGTYVENGSENVLWSEALEEYFYIPKWPHLKSCDNCSTIYPFDPSKNYTIQSLPIYSNDSTEFCESCISEAGFTLSKCANCHCQIPDSSSGLFVHTFYTFEDGIEGTSQCCNDCWGSRVYPYEKRQMPETVMCLCGEKAAKKDFESVTFNKHTPITQTINKNMKIVEYVIKEDTQLLHHSTDENVSNLNKIFSSFLMGSFKACPSCVAEQEKIKNSPDSGSKLQNFLVERICNLESLVENASPGQKVLNDLYGTYFEIYGGF